MSDKNPAPAPETGSAVVVATPVSERVLAVYEAGILAIPDAGGEGMENILAQLAGAQSPYQLDQPWQAGGLQAWRDRQIVVVGMRKMASDFEGPLPWFLILDCADPATGETFTATTGALSIVAQLVIAHQNGWLPLQVIPRMAKKPTAEGYYPMHLDVVRNQQVGRV